MIEMCITKDDENKIICSLNQIVLIWNIFL